MAAGWRLVRRYSGDVWASAATASPVKNTESAGPSPMTMIRGLVIGLRVALDLTERDGRRSDGSGDHQITDCWTRRWNHLIASGHLLPAAVLRVDADLQRRFGRGHLG